MAYHCKQFTCDRSIDEALKAMCQPTSFLTFKETAMNWRSPSTTSPCTAQLDPLHNVVIIAGLGKEKMVIPIEWMSDVRDVPFEDETTSHPYNDPEHLVEIAYFSDGIMDFYDTQFVGLVAKSDTVAKYWRFGLHHLIGNTTYSCSRYAPPAERVGWLYSRSWAQADESGSIRLKELADSVCKDARDATLEFFKKEPAFHETVHDIKSSVDINKVDLLTYERLLGAIYARPDLDLLRPLFNDNDTITAAQLKKFLNEHQRDPRLNEILDPLATDEDCQAIIAEFERDPHLRQNQRLSYQGLNRYLMSKRCGALDINHRSVFEDMSQPLAHYFISSSHNTYLTGGQLNSASTVEIYRQVLLAGCRCVEIDIWNGDDGEPIVTHGLTLCTQISFKLVVKAIAEYAFLNNPWPLILSFENHCNTEQMKKMAAYCKEYFGDRLQSEFLPGDGYDCLPRELPSPQDLKYKIIIKNKKCKPSGTVDNVPIAYEAEQGAVIEIDGEVEAENEEDVRRRKERSKEIAKELSDLVNYCTPFHFQDFEVARQNHCCYHISSFGEKRGTRLVSGKPQDFVDYNKLQLSRIYPAGSRISSTNYNPQLFWNVGSQLVALNWQTMDSNMQINMGRFVPNGKSGYALKPRILTDPSKTFDPFEMLAIQGVVPLTCTITVMSMQGVRSRSCQPVVEVSMVGLPADSKKRTFQTRPSRGRGLSPRWKSDNVFEIERILLPQLAMLRFSVTDNRDQSFLGYACIPMASIRSGYRYIQLTHAKHPMAQLFVKLDIGIFTAAEHEDFIARIMNPVQYDKLSQRNMAELQELLEEDEGGVGAPIDESGKMTEADLQAQLGKTGSTSTISQTGTMISMSKGSGDLVGSSTTVRARIQSEVESFTTRLTEHLSSRLVPWERHRDECLKSKKAIALEKTMKKNHAKAIAAWNKHLKKVMSDFDKAMKATFKSLLKQLKSGKTTQLDGLEAIIEEELATLQDLEKAHLEFLESKIHSTTHEYQRKLLDLIQAVVLKQQEQEQTALRKAIDQFSDTHSAVIRKEFKDPESIQDVEKRLVQAAVSIHQQFNRRVETHKNEVTSYMEREMEKLEDAHRKHVRDVQQQFSASYGACRAVLNDQTPWNEQGVAAYLDEAKSIRWLPVLSLEPLPSQTS
eukprot:TRINITY_DN7664_c1_g1_i1.p1 TRINITY_DN7664_c1_g1~~TRINITY_DN7664_c1_g1_i1.p1  ORF type:complete len:1148 (+),score=314.48 TRINITY_DN7664_c1_g1_i1:83-3526(+)